MLLAADGEDGNGLQLKKDGSTSQVLALCLRKVAQN